MSLKRILVITLALVLGLAGNGRAAERQARQSVNCTNVSEMLDRCGALASYSHTIPGSAYPASLEELREACPRHHEGLHCLRQHVKCLKPLTKRAILSFIDGRKKHVKALCSDLKSSAARDFTDAYACIRRHKREKFVRSETLAIRRMDALMSEQVSSFEERFQRSCCAIHNYRLRTIEDMGPECSAGRLQSAVESALESVVGQAIEFACPDSKSNLCASMRELQLSSAPLNKTLTRAGTELLVMLTETDDAGEGLRKPRRAARS